MNKEFRRRKECHVVSDAWSSSMALFLVRLAESEKETGFCDTGCSRKMGFLLLYPRLHLLLVTYFLVFLRDLHDQIVELYTRSHFCLLIHDRSVLCQALKIN
ncbi:hypothetical protein BRADI_1g13868v3 [Brachypodium distachyon]|uniref:Uncharacterized protein n=1 Tax=Brachypodium distachyon TaxID=15368 RepID=A0A0Q3JPY1_BRADI|nr:hypothetical protein BRADI_1g13868v3 [Brachypodium distachyon]